MCYMCITKPVNITTTTTTAVYHCDVTVISYYVSAARVAVPYSVRGMCLALTLHDCTMPHFLKALC